MENKVKEIVSSKSLNQIIKELWSWNSLTFYKKNWLITRYADFVDLNIIHYKDWFEQQSKFTEYGIDYDFNKSFFENFEILMKKMPWPNVYHYSMENENADYADILRMSKNVYLSKVVIQDCSNVLYSYVVKENSHNVFNSVFVIWNNDNIYWSFWVFNSFNVFYSKYIVNSSDIWFSTNLIGCKECIFCDWLENASYCINNVQYSKEEYEKKKQEILSQKEKFEDWYNNLNAKWKNFGSQNVDWEFVVNSQDVQQWYFGYNIKNWNKFFFIGGTNGDEDFEWLMFAWSPYLREAYNSSMFWDTEKVYFSWLVGTGYDIWYSMYVHNIKYCFGCIGLMDKEFCILNKQYTKEEYFEMKKKILNQMDKEWTLWKYFPASLNLFYFNETWADILWNFDKQEIISEWYKWNEEWIKVDIPANVKLVNIKDVDIVNFDENVLKVVYSDDKWNYWRIMPLEYKFLKKYWLPLPRIHWLDRFYVHLKNIRVK